MFLHLLQHIQNNDHHILTLLSSRNNELFLGYFRVNLETLVDSHLSMFDSPKRNQVPDEFWKNHIVSTFVETIKWWIAGGMKETPEVITGYFFLLI